jgi:hypothetical protein
MEKWPRRAPCVFMFKAITLYGNNKWYSHLDGLPCTNSGLPWPSKRSFYFLIREKKTSLYMEHVCMLQTITATPYPKRTECTWLATSLPFTWHDRYYSIHMAGQILQYSHGTTDITICRKQNLKVCKKVAVAGHKSSIKCKSLIHQFGIKCYNISKFTCWYGVDARAWVKIWPNFFRPG